MCYNYFVGKFWYTDYDIIIIGGFEFERTNI